MSAAKKLRSEIMEILFKVNDVDLLKLIRYQLEKTQDSEKSQKELPFMEAVKPIRKEVSLDALINEQNYKPISYQQFRKKADKIVWKESLDELLEALNK